MRLLLRGQAFQRQQLELAVVEWEASRFKPLRRRPIDTPARRRAPYDATFFYPQRLWLAFSGSFFVQLTLTLARKALFQPLVPPAHNLAVARLRMP